MVAALMFLLCGIGSAQTWGQRDNRWGWQNRQDQKEYEHGMRDGQNDRSHNRSWHPRHNERDYMAGYRAGFGSDRGYGRGGRDGDGDHDRDDRRPSRDNSGYYPNTGNYPNRYPNGQYPNGQYGNGNIQQIGYQNGFQQGLHYGAEDRNTGHSNRPDYSSTYRNGSNGYNPSYGDKMTYKRAFQEGFRAGYAQAYEGRGGYRR